MSCLTVTSRALMSSRRGVTAVGFRGLFGVEGFHLCGARSSGPALCFRNTSSRRLHSVRVQLPTHAAQ
jgi:hypothetical protein